MAKRFEALNRLIDSVRESNHDFRITTDPFPPLDSEKLAKTMELAKKGANNGAEDKPVQSAKALDDVEKEILNKVETERDDSYQILEDQLHTYATRMQNLDFDGHFGRIRQANISSLTDFKADVAGGRDELFGLRRNLKEADEELANFKKDNGLKRVAQTKSELATFIKWLIIVALLIAETIVNGIYLAQGSDQGLVGGVGLAFGFAFANVGGTVLLALAFVPNIVHRSWFRKLWGLIGIVLWLCLAIGLNIAMAHYREAAAATATDIGATVMTRLKTDPLALRDIDSWILFGTGFIFSAVALFDVLSIRDIYPGYGGVHTRYVKARDNYVYHKLDLIDQLKDIRDDHNTKVDTIIRDLTIRRRECASIIENRARIVRLFNDQQDRLEECARKLLTIYREANRQARTKPEPKHFSTQYKLERRKPVIDTGDDWNDKELAARIKAAEDELAEQMRQIGQEFESAVTAYHQLDNLFPENINVQTTA
ncbi:DMT family transporter [Mycoplana dimorpha]|uniref:Transmembrane protein n=1 Tax=Mycoplana dimorpha TaxID=28320 RepID=A0A2T5ATW6_MYCDI|nr:DMT family transporter [Mycoplana dimorpha]PTM90143.1 hypothetical protein C7449_11023 [Mycoplana dimorpha]